MKIAMNPVEQWFHNLILEGLQKLLCLSLERQPSFEVLAGTAMAWEEAIWPGRAWDEGRDTSRIREAFRALLKTCVAWPPPARFFEVFPRFEQLTQPRLTSVASDATRKRCMQDIAAIIDRLDASDLDRGDAPTSVESDESKAA